MQNWFKMFPKETPNTFQGLCGFYAELRQYGKEKVLDFYKEDIEKNPILSELIEKLHSKDILEEDLIKGMETIHLVLNNYGK